ncbi:SDR family NAD(P)-dependent oxidoreductase [Noviherbaspirillum denitrificans]|uniref:2-hydroxycyclohexanecarboxyl-CoA dehydrogenase n=1 Tax=Noviherbaspirillum denitrificans TaxID=1968433 RepID=A0A254T8P1_9BURK|nr:3-oxoacyl-ACP reductase family protein [Noviherbaspirillum denitrificans]OWW19020.1 2-hydroxycyclohexanecarboxyl-CoA dehydrogenase [Noviherbaspirillum denitrificans]
MDLSNKAAIVTGGGSGIGRATCIALAKAGARVFIGDINTASAEAVANDIRAAGGKADALFLDITSDEAIKGFADQVHAQVGKVDIVVNGAGWDIIEPFIKNTPEYWDKIMAINFMGPVKVTRAFLDPMIEGKSGKVVNISSDAGRGGSSGETVYAGAKGGVIAFTKSLARELARYGINVNCVCPGPTDTPLFATQPEKVRDALTNAIPFRRLGKPEEVADAVTFFASDRSSFITGQVLSVSGGLTMHG